MANSSPYTLLVGDRDYEVEVTVATQGTVIGGLVLFYSERMFCGVGLASGSLRTYVYGQEHSWMTLPAVGPTTRLRLRSVGHVVTWWYTDSDGVWIRHPWQMEVSGIHHNVFGEFTALKVGLLAAGEGSATYSDFTYRGH